jgi:hypothetical protein
MSGYGPGEFVIWLLSLAVMVAIVRLVGCIPAPLVYRRGSAPASAADARCHQRHLWAEP